MRISRLQDHFRWFPFKLLKTIRQSNDEALQDYFTLPIYSLIRFKEWDELLTTPAPNTNQAYSIGVWRFARGLAFAERYQLAQARQELAQLHAIAPTSDLEKASVGELSTPAYQLLIAIEALAGKIAARSGDYEQAIAHLWTAVNIEDRLGLHQQVFWAIPARQHLGSTLLEAKRSADAEQVYREDLAIHPDSGWSLQGLQQSLLAQGKGKEAHLAQERLKQVWQYADAPLATLPLGQHSC